MGEVSTQRRGLLRETVFGVEKIFGEFFGSFPGIKVDPRTIVMIKVDPRTIVAAITIIIVTTNLLVIRN